MHMDIGTPMIKLIACKKEYYQRGEHRSLIQKILLLCWYVQISLTSSR